jgi:hypothetical protein
MVTTTAAISTRSFQEEEVGVDFELENNVISHSQPGCLEIYRHNI